MNKDNLATATYTFQIEPDDQGGKTKTVSINRHNTAEHPEQGKAQTKKKEPTAHLLIGFDTEYQAISENELKSTVEHGARNDLLSYQFSIKLLVQGVTEGHPETEGIIIPKPDQRITMKDFIGFAIGSLIDHYPGIKLPASVYLLGHFIRADLPAFSDFQDNARLTSSVRSTFVSIRNAINIAFSEGAEHIADFKVSVRDTILLAPANAKSLADVGQIVGFDKVQLGASHEEDKVLISTES